VAPVHRTPKNTPGVDRIPEHDRIQFRAGAPQHDRTADPALGGAGSAGVGYPRQVPREDFVPERYRNLAFSDVAIPLGHGEFMLKPPIEGRLLQALAVQPTDQVLEVGTGSGLSDRLSGAAGRQRGQRGHRPEFIEAARPSSRRMASSNVAACGDASRAGASTATAIAVTGSVAMVADAGGKA
jgi:hypothetical protein